MRHHSFILITCVLAALSGLWAQAAPEAPFRQGVNLTGWLQEPSLNSILPERFGEEDFANIKSLGCDVIRLPVNLGRIARSSPGGRIPPRLFELLDRAVTWADRQGLWLILDNHTVEDDFTLAADLATTLPALWTELATHFKAGPERLVYEIFNEPHDLPLGAWDRIQRATLAAIRQVDRRHLVVVSGDEWGGIDGLLTLKPYADPKLLYSFHFYDPMIFTHQGAGWVEQESLGGLPFPPDPTRPPLIGPPRHDELAAEVAAYTAGDPTVAMRRQLDRVRDWARSNQVAVFCGEMGVHNQTAPAADRVRWYAFTRQALRERGLAFLSWDYQGSFGIFRRGSPERFTHDLDLPLLEALGLKPPAQSVWVKRPETSGFPIFGEAVARGIGLDLNPQGGRIDLLSTDRPRTGRWCLRLTGLGQYGSVGFTFRPEKDLGTLAGRGSLRFWVRGNRPGASLEMRFIMSTNERDDRPWRMSFTLDQTIAPWDGQWYQISLPLSGFAETGAWNGSWHEPEGRFDWRRVERLEITAEQAALGEARFWFNGIELAP